MNLEIKILNDISNVKNILKRVSNYYQEDFLLADVVFISIDNIYKLKPIQFDIHIFEEKYAYQY